VLVVKLAAMGDVLRTTSILKGLRHKYQAPVVWVTRPESVDLLTHNALIDEVWPLDDSLPTRFEAEPFKAVINPDAERSSAAVAAMARTTERIGFTLDGNGHVTPLSEAARRWFSMGINDELKRQNNSTYQKIIAEVVGIPGGEGEIVLDLTDDERAKATRFAARALPRNSGPVIGFNTGGAGRWKRKQWSFGGFAELGARILRETDFSILLYGAAQEQEFNLQQEKILNSHRVINVNTQGSVRDFVVMLSVCDVLVTGDTLGLHVGAALRKQLVVIFGPTSAAEIELYGRGTKVVPDAECRSFYRQECEAVPCCVDTISADAVFAAVQRAVREVASSGADRQAG
jgi:heptosyltransferase-2